MSNTPDTILMVYGNDVFAESARRVIEAVFGPCRDEADAKPYVSGPEAKPLFIVRPESSEALASAVLTEVSSRLPEVVFKIAYDDAVKGLRIGATYSAGRVGGDPLEGGRTAGLWCDGHNMPATAGEPTPAKPGTLRSIAEQYLSRGYSYAYEAIDTGCGIVGEDRRRQDELFEMYETVKSLLGPGDREECEQTARQYKAEVVLLTARAKAYHEAHDALQHFTKPEVLSLLDADDLDALTRFAAVVKKFQPTFVAKCSLGSA